MMPLLAVKKGNHMNQDVITAIDACAKLFRFNLGDVVRYRCNAVQRFVVRNRSIEIGDSYALPVYMLSHIDPMGGVHVESFVAECEIEIAEKD